MRTSSRGIDRIALIFDEPNLVANAGLLLVATLARKLGLESLIDERVTIPSKSGGFSPGRKILTLVHAMIAGATHIEHANVLRAGKSAEVLCHRVMAPSTLGTFLRAFTFGHVRQLESVIGEAICRAWSAMTLPERLIIDVDSTICEVSGRKKQGASYGYTRKLGYHPLLATLASTGEVLHARMRKGSANTQRGTERFVCELIARVRRAGGTGTIVCRFDSGYWSGKTIATLERLKVSYTMAVRAGNEAIAGVIATIEESSWASIDYPEEGEAGVAETTYKGRRLIVRRTRLLGSQAKLFPDWRYFAFLTDLTGPPVEVDAFHRERALTELDIRDLKEGTGMEHCPSGSFSANSAWLQCAVLAHDLFRWTQLLGDIHDSESGARPAFARTIRSCFVSMPGRLVNRSGRPTLRAPQRWPWRDTFSQALNALRELSIAIT